MVFKVNVFAEACGRKGFVFVFATLKFASVAGVISADDQTRFARMLFRATRGNCFFHFMEVEQPLVDPKSGALVRKAGAEGATDNCQAALSGIQAAQGQGVGLAVSGGCDVSKRSSVAAMPVRESVRGPIIE